MGIVCLYSFFEINFVNWTYTEAEKKIISYFSSSPLYFLNDKMLFILQKYL